MEIMSELKFRTVEAKDIEQLHDIYAYYVKNTAITFEYSVPTLAEFTTRVADISANYPYLVALIDDEIVGFAYAAPFNHREAYKWSVEMTIYLSHKKRGAGIGKALYRKLEEALKAQGIQNLNACISVPVDADEEHVSYASMHFHEREGYQLVGRFHKCAYKFETWYDMIWMEKAIGDHPVPAPELIMKKGLDF